MTIAGDLLPWGIYLLFGAVFSWLWWRLTRGVRTPILRSLLRGFALVLIFTPWYAGDNREHLAPALLVLLFELLIVDTTDGLRSALALTASSCLMLLGLVAWALVRGWGDGRKP